MSSHTPGPWKWDRVPLPGVSPSAVADVLNPVDWDGNRRGGAILRHEANGQTPWTPKEEDRNLIAAAPELLEVCKLWRRWMMAGQPSPFSDSALISLVDNAIDKAEGREAVRS